jgi:hypothetical protein
VVKLEFWDWTAELVDVVAWNFLTVSHQVGFVLALSQFHPVVGGMQIALPAQNNHHVRLIYRKGRATGR